MLTADTQTMKILEGGSLGEDQDDDDDDGDDGGEPADPDGKEPRAADLPVVPLRPEDLRG